MRLWTHVRDAAAAGALVGVKIGAALVVVIVTLLLLGFGVGDYLTTRQNAAFAASVAQQVLRAQAPPTITPPAPPAAPPQTPAPKK